MKVTKSLVLMGVLGVVLSIAACGPGENGNGQLPAIDLSAMTASTVTNCEFFAAVNTFTTGTANVAGVVRFGADYNAAVTNGLPLANLENGNVVFEAVNSDVTVKGTWGGDITEDKLQDTGVVIGSRITYDGTNYVLTIDKTKFNFGVNKIAFASLLRDNAWGAANITLAGIADNAIPTQAATGDGITAFTDFIDISLDATPDADVIWVGTNSGANGIEYLGVKNLARTFEIYLQGSLANADLVADDSDALVAEDLWAMVMIILAK